MNRRLADGQAWRSSFMGIAALLLVVALAAGCAALNQQPQPPVPALAVTQPVAGTPPTPSDAGRFAATAATDASAATQPASAVQTRPAAPKTATARETAPATATKTGRANTATPALPSAGETIPGLAISTPRPGDTLPTVRLDRLPPEARTTLTLIARGGPYPYRQDGVVFENRENLLPRRSSGYYHEFTVVTPGSADRGARRIVRGAQAETYYTGDHYASFKQVVP